MWEEIINLAIGNGLWAVLFCILFVYQIKSSRVRENKYQQTIKTLSDSFACLREIDAGLKGVKKSIDRIERRERRRISDDRKKKTEPPCDKAGSAA